MMLRDGGAEGAQQQKQQQKQKQLEGGGGEMEKVVCGRRRTRLLEG